jgi:hypothetical protein
MQLHNYSYDLGVRPLTEGAGATFGTAAHAQLEARMLDMRRGDGGITTTQAIVDAMAGLEPAEQIRLSAVMDGYSERWADDAERYQVLAVEQQFEAPLRNPRTRRKHREWRIAGKLDVILLERATNRVLVMEHKTTSSDASTGSVYWQRLRLDSQISMYLDGAAALGYKAVGVLYDVIGKPDLRPYKATPAEARKYTKDGKLYAAQRAEDETMASYRDRLLAAIAEAPDRYYQRGEIVRIGGELDRARKDVWDVAHLIDTGRTPRNPDACLRHYGQPCPFLPVCGGEASLDDPTRYRKLETPHPELEATA